MPLDAAAGPRGRRSAGRPPVERPSGGRAHRARTAVTGDAPPAAGGDSAGGALPDGDLSGGVVDPAGGAPGAGDPATVVGSAGGDRSGGSAGGDRSGGSAGGDRSGGSAGGVGRIPAPVWRPVRGGNAFEITVSRLAQAIRLGMVGVGERLPAERDLAARLRVSRVTLREAIAALREAGYLESRRGRLGGTFVLSATATRPGGAVRPDATELAREMGESLHDALDFRRVIEPGAAGLAAGRALSAAERQHLVACLAASRERDAGTRRTADSRLHLAIAAAGGSPSLTAAVADVQLSLDRLLVAIPVIRRNLDHSDDQHARVIDAILAGDPAGARSGMEEHCDGTAELLRGLLGRP